MLRPKRLCVNNDYHNYNSQSGTVVSCTIHHVLTEYDVIIKSSNFPTYQALLKLFLSLMYGQSNPTSLQR